MNKNYNEIVAHWRTAYSENIERYSNFNIPEQFNQIASLFTPGKSYYYIINFHNLELEFVSPSIQEFVDADYESLSINDILKTALPEEIKYVKLKEKVVEDFFMNYLNKNDFMDYKVVYSYKMRDRNGKERTMLHQATALSVDKNGYFMHVLSIHSDITHLNVIRNNAISFMNLKGGESFFNQDISEGRFIPNQEQKQSRLKALLSEREKQIISEIALGLSNIQIAEKLNISPHTVKTHRKNILEKSGCDNSAQLVANCLVGGVINIGM